MWVQRFIEGFGGDAARVTAMGESAGAMSICAQILAEGKGEEGALFNRVVLMSGVLGPATAPESKEEGRQIYERFVKELGIEGDGNEALEKLRELDVETIVETSGRMGEDGALWRTQRDDEFFGEKAGDLTWDRIPKYIGDAEGLEEIILGSTSFEVGCELIEGEHTS